MKVFLDMDGVVADFVAGMCQKFNHKEPIRHYDMWHELGITKQEFYDACTDEFYENLPMTPFGRDLFDEIYAKVGTWNIIFLTSPVDERIKGKMRWLEKHFKFWFTNKRFLIGSCKAVVAHPNAVLIDDNDDNIRRFEEAGGHGILVPSTYNKRSNDVLDLDKEWRRICEEKQ